MKKKADVVYTSAGSHSSRGSTLSKVVSFHLAHLSTMSMRNKKKKKRLIVSGIAVDDTKKFKGVKRWCEVGHFASCLASPLSDCLIRVSAKCDRSCVCLMGILLYHFKAQRWLIQYVESAQAFSSWALGVYKCLGRPKKSDEFDLIFITLLMCDHNHDNNEKLVFLLFSLS